MCTNVHVYCYKVSRCIAVAEEAGKRETRQREWRVCIYVYLITQSERILLSLEEMCFLSLDLLLASTNAAETAPQALASSVASSNTRCLGIILLGWDDSRCFSVV
jgi:hypothetical protein